MQYFGNIYYRVFKEISPGCEILVWYDDTCPHYLGIPLKMQDIGASTNTHGKNPNNIYTYMSTSAIIHTFSKNTATIGYGHITQTRIIKNIL